MPTTAGTWQPPATGAIKDGFMRADGGSVPTCADCSIPQGTVLPDMRQRYAKGSNVGTSGTTGGSNVYTPAGTNAASNVPASGLTFSGTSGTYSVSVPGHYHLMGTGADLNITSSGGTTVTGTVGGTDGTHTHTLTYRDQVVGASGGSTAVQMQVSAANNLQSITNVISTTSSGHGHGFSLTAPDHTHASNKFSGSIGLFTGGQNGNGTFTASGSNTPAGSIAGTATAAAQAFTGTAGNNEPAYVEVVWVIRVK